MKVNSQLERAQLENVTSLPSAATAGRVAWDTVAGKAFLDDATNWRAFLRNDQLAIIGNSGTAANNTRFHRGANGVLQLVSGADATAEGTLSTAINQISARVENYSTGSLPAFGNLGRLAYDTTTGFPKFDNGSAWKEIVDSNTAQTISAKTFSACFISGDLTFNQISTPSNPAAGFNKIYFKSDGLLYRLDSTGAESSVASSQNFMPSSLGRDTTAATPTNATYITVTPTANRTETLPAATGSGREYVFERTNAANTFVTTVDGNGSDTIGGAASKGLFVLGDWFWIKDTASGVWTVIHDGTGAVSAKYRTAAGQSIAVSPGEAVDFGTQDWDTHGAVTNPTTDWRFVAPISGEFVFNISIRWDGSFTANNNVFLRLYKNGVAGDVINLVTVAITGATNNLTVAGNGRVKLLAGDYVQIYAVHQEAAARTLFANNISNWIEVNRVGVY